MKKKKKIMTEEEINIAYNNCLIRLNEASELKKGNAKTQLAKENSYAKFSKNIDIKEAFSKGELSTTNTIVFKTMLLIERNRKNTSVMTTIVVVQFVATIIGVFVVLTNR